GRKIVFLLDTVEHLARGLLSEGQQQDALGRDALLAKPPVALDQDARLSGAGTRHDQERPLRVVDGGPLGVGQRPASGDHRHDFHPPWGEGRAGVPDCRNRISRTAVAPIPSFSRSINMVRSRWSWWA